MSDALSTSPAAPANADANLNGGSTSSAPVAASTWTQTTAPNATATTTSAVATPWFQDWLQSDGSVNPKSYERMPDDLKHLAPSLANAKNVNEIFQKMAHLNTLAGKKGLAPLPADAPPDAVKARNELMRQINGVPDKPADYGIVRPENVPAEQWNQPYVDGALGIMHKFNAPPGMVKELVALNMQTADAQQKQTAEFEKQFFASQQKEAANLFTKDGTSYEKGLELAQRTARQLGIDPENDPEFKSAKTIYAFYQVQKMIGEPKLVTGEGKALEGNDPAALAHDVRTNKANPMYKEYYAGNKSVLARVLGWENEARSRAAAAANAGGPRR